MRNAGLFIILTVALVILLCQGGKAHSESMGTAFTYQGRLIDGNDVADGLYDFQFKLYDTSSDGNQINGDVSVPDLDVNDGHFVLFLDFGSEVFDGEARWLEVGVRPGELNDPNTYTTLSPRQQITAVPYALQTRGIFVDEEGNVGIGTTEPQNLLQVGDGTFRITRPENNVSISDRDAPEMTPDAKLEITTGTNSDFLMVSSTPNADGDMLIVKNDGKVGIGTNQPEKLLHIVNKNGGYDGLGICLDPHGGGFIGGTTWDIENDVDFKLIESRALPGYPKTRLAISNGNIGIGTTGPDEQLHISGNIKIVDGNQGEGKVLTSDANGVGNWQAPPDSTLPSGVIVMWSGSIGNIPAGWVLCDGDSNTPDLRDRFVVGATEDDGEVAKTNITGSLTKSGGDTSHDHGGLTGEAGGQQIFKGNGLKGRTAKHQHPINSDEHVPPYYALAFIMKL